MKKSPHERALAKVARQVKSRRHLIKLPRAVLFIPPDEFMHIWMATQGVQRYRARSEWLNVAHIIVNGVAVAPKI